MDRHQAVEKNPMICAICRVVLQPLAVVAFLLHVHTVSLWAQSDSAIRGQVVAAADGSALAGAVVTLKALPIGETA